MEAQNHLNFRTDGNIDMSIDEFITKLIEGEKDFDNVSLPPNADLTQHPSYERLTVEEQNDADLYAVVNPNNPEKCERLEVEQVPNRVESEPVYLRDANLDGIIAPQIDLQNVEGEGMRLRNANLRGANLHGAQLEEAKLNGQKGNFARIDLGNAYLWDTCLSNANFQEANFTEATLCFTTANRADFRDADFTGADLMRPNFVDAKLEGSNIVQAKRVHSGYFVNTDATKEQKKRIKRKIHENYF